RSTTSSRRSIPCRSSRTISCCPIPTPLPWWRARCERRHGGSGCWARGRASGGGIAGIAGCRGLGAGWGAGGAGGGRRLWGLAGERVRRRAEVAREEDEARMLRFEDDLRALAALHAFASPLIHRLAALPRRAVWGEWLEHLRTLVT